MTQALGAETDLVLITAMDFDDRAALDAGLASDAMRQAGYQDADYTLVVASYASPVTEAMVSTHGFIGCPFRKEDAKWGRTTAVPQLSVALRSVADQVGARFLDAYRARRGRKAR